MLDNVGHQFGSAPPLFTTLSAAYTSGQIVALVGPSGSGKSTLLAILAGWLAPSEGEVRGVKSARFAWAFQNPIGVSRRSALDHVVLPFLARGETRAEAETNARELLATFNLTAAAERPFSALSGGESQRLMLARAVATSADVLLIDEPTAQLDRTSAESVIEVIGHLAKEGSLVLIATHDDRVRDRCDALLDLAT